MLVTDVVGNTFSAAGPLPLIVTDTDPDNQSPVQTAVSLSTAAVDVSTGPQNATCTMTITDDKSGVYVAACAILSPSHNQKSICEAFAPSSGTNTNGVYSCTATIPQYAEAGVWISTGVAEDLPFNNPLDGGPPATSLTVTSVPSDSTAPTLTTFDFNPKTVSDGAEQKQVVCTMGVSDSPAGVALAECLFTLAGSSVQPFCIATTPSSGTKNNGTFQCHVNIPRYAAAGTWSSTVNVDCAAGDPETTCRFAADRQSLTWDVVAGATRYNLYRGPLTNLVDANADHLPDGGYGTCQNARDANLTDTTFIDTDVPTPAQKGIFYLIDYKSAGLELGLGANSFGAARTEASPCP